MADYTETEMQARAGTDEKQKADLTPRTDPAGGRSNGSQQRLDRYSAVVETPPTSESAPAPSTLVFPHVVDGGGYTTQFVTYSGTPAEPTSGNLQLFSQSGGSLGVNLK